MPISEEILQGVRKEADELDADVYLFNGTLARTRDLHCVEEIKRHNGHKKAILFLVTNGGDPDAAYKIARYFQDHYEHFAVVVSGMCKSAGTLLAIGANELIFTPFGELGPLDVQHTKVDRFDQMQSGLTIQDALDTLEKRATTSFYRIISEYIQSNAGLISFATASKAASDFVTQLYAPVFSRIDPEEVGGRARSMRIAADYGARLALKSQNLKDKDSLRVLAETYPSHSFVIDYREAERLFRQVRLATEQEKNIVHKLGNFARFESQRGGDFIFTPLSTSRKDANAQEGKQANGKDNQRTGNPAANGGDPSEPTDQEFRAAPGRNRTRKPAFQKKPASNGSAKRS